MAKKETPRITPPEQGQVVRIKAQRDGYRRAGVAHTKAPVDHAHDTFSPAQLEQLQADPNLSVSVVDKPKSTAVPTDKPNDAPKRTGGD
jgi:hypothetical protein